MNESKLMDLRLEHKPFEYPQCYEYYKRQAEVFWLPDEVNMADDINDYQHKLKPHEVNLINNILRFFTTADQEVMDNYNTSLVGNFPKPEVKMMLTFFAGMEVIHQDAYSHLNDTLGLPDEEYKAFREYAAMKDKFDLFHIKKLSDRNPDLGDLATNLAVFGGFIEGVSLFSSFAILLNFPRRGLMKSVGQIVSWSIRDENLHSEAISYLFRTLVDEYDLLDEDLIKNIQEACHEIVQAEFNFIDKCFELGDVDGLTATEVKSYVMYMANYRMKNLGLTPIFPVRDNPLPWITQMMSAKEHANFFETRATEYVKSSVIKGDWYFGR